MRKILLATAGLAIASPALAEGPYVGLEGGILFPQHMRGTYTSTYSQTAQTPAPGTAAAAPGTGLVGTLPTALTTMPAVTTGGASTRFKRGLDIDAIAGYNFGMFRLEGELGYKRSSVKSFSQDTAFGTSVTSFLNPTGATTATPFVFPNGNLNSFNLGNHVDVWSGMINGLLSFGNPNGLNFQGGSLYAETDSSGPPVEHNPGDNGTGQLLQGYLESSNVDLSHEFGELILIQRGFQAASQVVSVSNDMIQQLFAMRGQG